MNTLRLFPAHTGAPLSSDATFGREVRSRSSVAYFEPNKLARTHVFRHFAHMSSTEIFTDGSHIDKTQSGGWSTVIFRGNSGRQSNTSSQQMELRGLIEAVKMAEG